MRYELCKKYPDIQFVYNEGYKERFRGVVDKCDYEYEDRYSYRLEQEDWPTICIGKILDHQMD